MPASSKIWAAYMSYAVSIAHLRPSVFMACRCGMRTRRGEGDAPAVGGAPGAAAAPPVGWPAEP